MDLKKTLFIVPNLFTAASLFCGMLAVTRCIDPEATGEDVYRAALLLFFAFFFDMFDGRVARMTRTQSAFGVEFDSLADLVSFGVAPAVITYRWALADSGPAGVGACIIYVICGAVRLARFNVMSSVAKIPSTPPGRYMLGLPIPVAAGFIVALVVATRAMGGWPWLTAHGLTVRGISYPMMIVVMIGLAVLMVSSVRFRSFKDLRLTKVTLVILLLVLGASLVMWILFKPAYILVGLISLYLALGFIEEVIHFPRRARERRDLKRGDDS